MRDDDPVATHDLDVAAAHTCRDGALGAAFVAVELAGEQPFEADLVVFHFEQFELEALALRKAALGRQRLTAVQNPRAAISRKPASALGAMIPCFHGFGACAGAVPAQAASIVPAATSRAKMGIFISWPRRSRCRPAKDHLSKFLSKLMPLRRRPLIANNPLLR